MKRNLKDYTRKSINLNSWEGSQTCSAVFALQARFAIRSVLIWIAEDVSDMLRLFIEV